MPKKKRSSPRPPLKGCVYPNLSAWMQRNACGCTEFARRIDFSKTGVRSALTGVCGPSKMMIDAILEETGLPYEVAFQTEGRS